MGTYSNTRRSFIGKLGKGVALSTITLSGPSSFATNLIAKRTGTTKPIRIGVIGAENSHTKGFGKLFNIDKKFPGVEIKYVWGETEEFAKEAMKHGGIPNMVRDPKEMMGKIDGLIVDHRDGKYHLAAAISFVKAGVPTFVDKPFSTNLQEAKQFLAMAREVGTPVTSYSSIAQSYETDNIKSKVDKIGEINQIVRIGPYDINSIYGGAFFYGAHMIQPLTNIFGEDVAKVRVTKNGKGKNGAHLVFGNGMLASLIFSTKKYEWRTFVETDQGLTEMIPDVLTKDVSKADKDMVDMFKTGKEPRSHQSILNGIAILAALQKSTDSNQWEEVEKITI
ncbi:Gfo/Idh/MocA family oxidoreductase [Maribacter polysiphoniae]|uniref:Gfo/Idh/MocA family oxidoreductase n=1 Tax=Maribacter polysiphoniae TaxID=429344 RepID=A0A316EI11_9FLAO|nr:Gfo/Idh/MocA family oxidoreductase [Maribacter polysiphoniae]MBD1261637.1 Gfo/Idh/MocA family oxidoreductase [Maribacter polysiphoniae]PWK22560.1 putative dehydrogenase [Maribacter polysiphoniae]